MMKRQSGRAQEMSEPTSPLIMLYHEIPNTAETSSTAPYEVSARGRARIPLPTSGLRGGAPGAARPVRGLSQRGAHKPQASAPFCWHQTPALVHELETALDRFKLQNALFFCLLALRILLGFLFFFFFFIKCKMPRAFFGRIHCINRTLFNISMTYNMHRNYETG